MRIFVTMKPSSRTSGVEKISDNEYLVRVISPARRGKANKELIDLLSNFLKIPKGNIEIASGFRSRKKKIYINE